MPGEQDGKGDGDMVMRDTLLLYGTDLKKGDVIQMSISPQENYVVVKVYKYTLWRRILSWFGKPFEYHNCVKIQKISA